MNHVPTRVFQDFAATARHAEQEDPEGLRPELEHRLAELLRHSGTLLAGRVNVINLDAVREELGARWPRLQSRVLDFVRTKIRAAIGPDDILARYGDAQFVILFARRDADSAQQVCVGLSKIVSDFLMGLDANGQKLQVLTAVGEIEGKVLLELLGNDDLAMVDAEEPPAESPKAEASYRYLSMWDVRRKAITTFACVRETTRLDGSPQLGYPVTTEPGDPAYVANIDLATLVRGARDLGLLIASGTRALVVCSVHAVTLERSATQSWYLSACAGLGEVVRRHLIIEVVGLPVDAPSTRVSRPVNLIRSYCRAVIVRSSLASGSMGNLRVCGVHGVSVDLAPGPMSESRMQDGLGKFAAHAAANSITSAAFGVKTTSLALMCVGAGFNYVNGPVIGSVDLGPTALQRFQLPDLYRHVPQAAA